MIEALAWPLVALVGIAVFAWLIVRAPTAAVDLEPLSKRLDELYALHRTHEHTRCDARGKGYEARLSALEKSSDESHDQIQSEVEKLRAVLSPIATAHALRNR